MRTRPYRNIRIINAIRDLFFTGGISSFGNRFRSNFVIHQGKDGVVSREVPIAMVALVSTGVSDKYTNDYIRVGLTRYQLYAAIKEWDTGSLKTMDFSASAFMDVYDGHVNTFKHIRQNREDAYHVIMSDIYLQAR
jgi:hypothetical protein